MNKMSVSIFAAVTTAACCTQSVTAQEFDFVKTSGIFVAKGFNIEIDEFGAMTVWRVYVNIGVGNQVLAVFGDLSTPLSIVPSGGFFQHPLGEDVEMDADLLAAFPTLQWDSYVTIGNLALDSGEIATQLSPFFPSGYASGGPWGTDGLFTDNGAWFRTPILPDGKTENDSYSFTFADDEGLVLIGQFTVPQTTHMDGVVGVAVRVGGESNNLTGQTFNFNPIDVNEDGEVNEQDLILVLDDWGECDCPSDVTGDDVVNITDLVLVVVNWNANAG